MKLLTKKTDYAIRALLALAQNPDEYISSKEIAKKQKIPYQYLRKILQAVISEGLVESREGGKGGVKIKLAPNKIKVVDVINIFQGDLEFSDCMFRKKLCHNRTTCVLRRNIKRIEDLVIKEFKGITIGSLLKEMKK